MASNTENVSIWWRHRVNTGMWHLSNTTNGVCMDGGQYPIPAGTRRNNNVFTTSTRRRRRWDVFTVKTLCNVVFVFKHTLQRLIGVLCENIAWFISCIVICSPFYQHGLTSIPTWISNHMPSKWRMKLLIHSQTSTLLQRWEWIRNFIPHFIMDVLTYSCWDKSQSMLV